MKSSNYWLAGLGIAAVAGLTYYIVKETKKSEKEISDQEEETEKSLEKVGVSTETLKENNVSIINSDNLVQEMHKTILTSNRWDLDLIDPEKVLQDTTIVHVSESYFNDKKQLDFVFELPNITERKSTEGYKHNIINSSYKYPKIRDFKLAFDKLADDLAKFVGTGNFKPFRKLEAYVTVQITSESGNVEIFTKRVPSEWYAEKKNDNNDGVVAFYGDYKSSDTDLSEKAKQILKERFIENFVVGDDSKYTFEVVDLYLGWRISFQERSGNFRSGINLISGLECLKYVTEEFSVKRDGATENVVYYKSILFHGPSNLSESLSNSFYGLDGSLDDIEY